MKKIVLGGFLLLSGILGSAILMAGTMSQLLYLDNELSFLWSLSVYGLTPVLYIFVILGAAGLLIGCWGLFDKKGK